MQRLKECMMDVLNKFGHNIKNFGIGLGLVSLVACGEADVKSDTGNGTTNPSIGVGVDNKPKVLVLENSKVDLGVYTLFPKGSTGSDGRIQVPHSLGFIDQNNNLARLITQDADRPDMVLDFSTNIWSVDLQGDYWADGGKGMIKVYAEKGGKFYIGGGAVDTVYINTPYINSSAVPRTGFENTPLIRLFKDYNDLLKGGNVIEYVGGNNAPYIPKTFKPG